MTQPGGIAIDIFADGGDLPEDMNRAVREALREVQLELDRNPLNVKVTVDIDTTAAIATAQANLNRAGLTARAGLDIDTATAVTVAQAALDTATLTARASLDIDTGAALAVAHTALSTAGLTARAGLDIDTATAITVAQAALDTASFTAKVTLDLELNITPQQQAVINEIRALNDKTVKIKIDLDMSDDELKRLKQLGPVLRQIQALTDKTTKVRIDLDLTDDELKRLKQLGPVLRSIKTLTDKDVRVKVNLDMSEEELRRLKQVGPALRSIGTLTDKDVRVKIKLDMSRGDARRMAAIAPALRSIRSLTDKDVTIRIRLDVDIARLAAVAALLREIRSRSVQVRVDTDDADRRVSDTDNRLKSLGKASAYLVGIPAAIAGIGGAAGAAAGLVGGLVAALGALGPAAAAAVGATAAVGMNGVMDSFKAFTAQTKAAGTEATSKAKEIATAQKAVESAERSLASAQKAAKAAQEDVTRARKAATDQLEDMKLASADAALSEKEAALALKEAREDARTAKGDDRAAALLRVERAQLTLAEAQERNRDQQEKAREAEEKGIENSDLVVAAKEKQATADEQLVAAQEALADATKAVSDAQNKASTSTQELNRVLAKLAPNARDFVLAAHELGDEWQTVGDAVQNKMFEGLGDTLTRVSGTVLPALQTGMVGVAGELNGMAQQFLNFAGSARGMEGLNATFANTTNLLHGMRSGTGEFGQGLIDMTVAAGPHMEAMGRSIAGIGESIGAAFTAAKDSGQLNSIFASMSGMFGGLGDTLGGLMTSLLTIAEQVMPSLGPMFTALGEALKAMAPGLGELGKAFADALTPILPTLGQLISNLASGLAPVLPVISNLIGAMAVAITPLIEPMSQVAQVLGQAITDAIVALTPAIGPLAQAFSSIVTALAPIIPIAADFISMIVQALAPAVKQIFDALAPVIAQLADQLRPVFEQMAPILAETAGIIGQALADAIKQLAPIIPPIVKAFGDLLLAVLPILPELAKMAADLLPPLVNVLVQLAPTIVRIIDALTWLVKEVIIPYVIPYFKDMSDRIKNDLEMIGDAIEWWQGIVEIAITWVLEKFDKFKSALTALKNWFNDELIPAIGRGADKLKDAFAIPIRWVVDNAWNKGLLKAWNAAAKFLPGVEEMEPVTVGFAKGGGVRGAGTGTSDDILAWLSNGEHVLTAREVARAGGQNVVYAIRDLISRGIPFEWNNGQLVSKLGRDNLDAYGAQVAQRGVGNVPPEGLFDPLLPGFREGGAILPWMLQLQRGHDFAKAQNGRPYQWSGPRFTGDSFDCSGFMGSIIAAILGGNPWQRYWSTSTFNGYPQTGAQGLVRNLTDGSGMAVGITDDPGGPGGGHTAGELRAIPELGYPAARVESDGSRGVHYGFGTNPASFDSLYGLPIGANGYFAPSPGGESGPTRSDQAGFLERKIREVFSKITDPIRKTIVSQIGEPPPAQRRIPPEFLTTVEDKAIGWMSGLATNLGDLLPSAFTKAQEVGGNILDALNPFDNGGIASGKGFMPKNIVEPERVLSPEQTRLFEALVAALEGISSGRGAATSTVVDALGTAVGSAVSDALTAAVPAPSEQTQDSVLDSQFLDAQREQFDQQGQLIADTQAIAVRTQSSTEQVLAAQFEDLQTQVAEVANRLTAGVLGPVVQTAMSSALGIVEKAVEASTTEITAAQEDTTTAVENLDTGTETPAFGSPDSEFDLASELSDAFVSVANTASESLIKLGQDIANKALEQRASRVDQSRGLLGSEEFSGGPLVDMIVRLTGVEIEIRELIHSLAEDVRAYRGEEFQAFDQNGQLISDTAALVERTASSMELVVAEQNRINRALIASVLRYLMVNVILPVLTAILTALITLAVTAIGAAIGTLIGGPIGTAIGAAIGAAVGLALSAGAAALLAGVGLGAAAAIDSIDQFDSGGVAHGTGFMSKNVIEPERVLSPQQTKSFDQLVQLLDRGAGNRTVQIGSMNFHGRSGSKNAADDLLSRLN